MRVNSLLPAAACSAADSNLFERKLTRMKTNSFVRGMALAGRHRSGSTGFCKTLHQDHHLSQTAKLGKSELKSGEYRLEIDGTKATVQKGKQVVANPKVAGKTAAPSPPMTPC